MESNSQEGEAEPCAPKTIVRSTHCQNYGEEPLKVREFIESYFSNPETMPSKLRSMKHAIGYRAAVVLLLLAIAGGARAEELGAGYENQKLVKILRTTNKAQTYHYVAKAYEMKNNNPYAVRRFLQRPIQVEEGGLFTYVNTDGNSGTVVIICPEHQIPYYDRLIPFLDRSKLGTADGSSRTYTKLKHRSVADLDFISTLTSFLTTGSFLLTDDETNAVYISDAPSGANTALSVLDGELDMPTDQVDIEVTIYEIDLNDDGSIGLDFHAWKNGPGRSLFAVGGFYELEDIGLEDASAPLFDNGSGIAGLPGERFNTHGYNASYFYNVPSAYFDFLASEGQAKVLLSTRLSVLNTDVGAVATGDQILFELVQNGPAPSGGVRSTGVALDPFGTDINNPNNRTVVGQLTGRQGGSISVDSLMRTNDGLSLGTRTLGAVDTGVFLQVSPIVGTDMINLDINYSVVNLTGFDGEGRPQLSSSEVQTNLRVQENKEIIIGSMARKADIKSGSKVPVLGSIPVIGRLFGGEKTQTRRTMVTIVLRPTIVRDATNMTSADMALIEDVNG